MRRSGSNCFIVVNMGGGGWGFIPEGVNFLGDWGILGLGDLGLGDGPVGRAEDSRSVPVGRAEAVRTGGRLLLCWSLWGFGEVTFLLGV